MTSKDKAAAGASFSSSNEIFENEYELHRTSTFAGESGSGLCRGWKPVSGQSATWELYVEKHGDSSAHAPPRVHSSCSEAEQSSRNWMKRGMEWTISSFTKVLVAVCADCSVFDNASVGAMSVKQVPFTCSLLREWFERIERKAGPPCCCRFLNSSCFCGSSSEAMGSTYRSTERARPSKCLVKQNKAIWAHPVRRWQA